MLPFPAGDVIIKKGTEGNVFYMVKEGAVMVSDIGDGRYVTDWLTDWLASTLPTNHPPTHPPTHLSWKYPSHLSYIVSMYLLTHLSTHWSFSGGQDVSQPQTRPRGVFWGTRFDYGWSASRYPHKYLPPLIRTLIMGDPRADRYSTQPQHHSNLPTPILRWPNNYHPPLYHQPITQSISIDQSINQSINQSISLNRSIARSIDRSITRPAANIVAVTNVVLMAIDRVSFNSLLGTLRYIRAGAGAWGRMLCFFPLCCSLSHPQKKRSINTSLTNTYPLYPPSLSSTH